MGNYLSTFLLSNVARLTSKHGHKGWILDNLNISHLDYYYAFLALISVVNFFFFLVIAKFFVYNDDVT
ncbi:putative proton-dependent oligopeptide transporter family [Medicago truncatula]|nr:putative proton-dependent oligopeptide transporter family [Medicago truncatula]